MRHTQNTQSGFRCEYPNSVHFSNVPAIVRAVFASTAPFIPDVMTIQLADPDGRTYTEYRSVHNREVVFDIRRFIQTAFVELDLDKVNYSGGMWTPNPNFRKITATVSYANSNNETIVVAAFNVDAVFGNIERGESTGGNMRRVWFINYPFTLDFYAKGGDTFDVNVDGENRPGVVFPAEGIGTPTSASGYTRVLLNVGELVDPLTIARNVRLVQPFGYVSENDVESSGVAAFDLDIDRTPKDAEKRVYLRWIDNQGRFCYWLFKDLGTTDTVAGSSYVSADIINPVIYNDAMNRGTEVRQSFARTKTRNLGAKSVGPELFDFLLTLISSPFVDMFDGYDENDVPQWHAVNVSPGTVTKTTKTLQEFKVAIVEPTQITQSL